MKNFPSGVLSIFKVELQTISTEQTEKVVNTQSRQHVTINKNALCGALTSNHLTRQSCYTQILPTYVSCLNHNH